MKSRPEFETVSNNKVFIVISSEDLLTFWSYTRHL